MDASSFLPTEAERKRVFGQLTTAPPLDEPGSSFCVFQRSSATKYEQCHRIDFHRIYYRQRTYHPKLLLTRWYFPHCIDNGVSRRFCRHHEKCVNPFHLVVDDDDKKTKTKVLSNVESPLMLAEKKRKSDELELTSTPEVKSSESLAFSRTSSSDSIKEDDDFLVKKRRFEALFQRDND